MKDLIKREDVLKMLKDDLYFCNKHKECAMKFVAIADYIDSAEIRINQLPVQNDCDCKMFIGGSGKLCPKCQEEVKT
jgi:hypothetical protein